MKSWLLITLVAATAASAQTSAQTSAPGFDTAPAAPQRPCLAPVEAKALATFILPGLVDGLAQRCRGSLGRGTFLRSDATRTLTSRLRRDAAPSWPLAKGAIEKLNGGDWLPGLLGERFIMGVAESTAADLALRRFDKDDCGAVDGLVGGLAPLPSSNFSDVISSLIALGGDQLGESPIRICAAVAAQARR